MKSCIYPYGEIFINHAEFFQTQFEDMSSATVYSNLEEISKVVIDIPNELLGRISVFNTFSKSGVISPAEQEYCIGLLSVTSSSACLLEISLKI